MGDDVLDAPTVGIEAIEASTASDGITVPDDQICSQPGERDRGRGWSRSRYGSRRNGSWCAVCHHGDRDRCRLGDGASPIRGARRQRVRSGRRCCPGQRERCLCAPADLDVSVVIIDLADLIADEVDLELQRFALMMHAALHR